MRHWKAAAIAAPVLLCSMGAAFAHAHLKTAEPAPDATVQHAPADVAITFSEGVEPRFSSIVVKDASGARVDKGDVHAAPGDDKRLMVSLRPLSAGTYTVVWHATSVDTHKTHGSYGFKVTQ